MKRVFFAITVLLCVLQPQAARLRIGVTLHPYYSFVKNIVQDKAEVLPLIESGGNVHGYRATPQDIKRATTMDILVVNGVGHDEFAFEILKAAGIEKKIPLIYANKDVALIPQSAHSSAINSHSFVSITAAIQQVYTIANGLAELDKANADVYRQNAGRYAGQLRRMKAEYMNRLKACKNLDFRCATIHGGYSYLLQEFGFQVEEVIEPGHGLTPSAGQLKDMIQRIKASQVKVIFAEADFPSDFARTVQKETGCAVRSLSHLSKGEFTAEYFEQGMRANLDALLGAVQGVQKQ
jgi:zinc transport system substrate-binding protein